jgi:hypothetical protein
VQVTLRACCTKELHKSGANRPLMITSAGTTPCMRRSDTSHVPTKAGCCGNTNVNSNVRALLRSGTSAAEECGSFKSFGLNVSACACSSACSVACSCAADSSPGVSTAASLPAAFVSLSVLRRLASKSSRVEVPTGRFLTIFALTVLDVVIWVVEAISFSSIRSSAAADVCYAR